MRILRLPRSTSKLKQFFPFVSITCQLHIIFQHQRHRYSSKSCSSYSNLLVGKDPTAIATALYHSENTKSYFLGTQIHGHIIKLGLTSDVFSQNNLVKMYSKFGLLSYGLNVFDEMLQRNLVSWTLIISGAIQNGEFDLGWEIYLDMMRSGLRPNEFTFGSVMKACAVMGAYELGLCIHGFALKIGMEKNPFVGSSMLNMYAKLGDIESSERVFECIDNLDVACWNSMIGGYAQCGCSFEALKIVSLMLYRGVKIDQFTLVNALKGCSIMGQLESGKQLHGIIIRLGVESSASVMNALMDMYFKNDGKDSALKVFNRMQNKDVISWNTVFGGFSQEEDAKEIAILFYEFMLTGLKPSHITFSALFRKCGELLDLDLGLQFVSHALRLGFFYEVNVTSSIINMFSRCGAVEMAHLVFDSIHIRNIITWNELISGYKVICQYTEALKIFCNLWELGVKADKYTFSSILEACCECGSQQIGRQIHGAILKSGFASHGYVCSSLIKAYITFGLLDDSFEFLNDVNRLDLPSWGAMISALVHQGYNHEAIRSFYSLVEAGEKPDEFILGSVLNSCAVVAAYLQTKSVHPHVLKMGFDKHVFVSSAVIDAYAKCGDLESSKMAFEQSFISNDVIIYNTMITAYAHHGLVMEALKIFEKMKLANLQPSQATFVSVISACSHMGLVDQGHLLFDSMTLNYGMEPSPDNYGCLVDMFSRNGYLADAKHIIEVMPFPPWPAIWRSLLSGCRIHGNRELGEWAAHNLVKMVPENDAAYVLLSKVYSEGGSWEDAAKVRRGMIERSVSKDPGYSRIEI
jgi:pentatricopeptide repeat protein